MKRHHFHDSIAWWFSINMTAAIFASLLMSIAFVQLGGFWAQPPLESNGLIQQAIGIIQTMDHIPAGERASLAGKLSSNTFDAHWYPSRPRIPMPENDDEDAHGTRWFELRDKFREKRFSTLRDELRDKLGRPDAGVLSFHAAGPGLTAWPASARRKYAFAIELSDHSWLGFGTDQRSWGLDRGVRWLLTALFILISSGTIASVASRRLARPMQQFAEAAEAFGASSRARPLQLTGPWEIREAAAAFNAMQGRIQQLMDSRTEMLTAISHDLRAPLTRMRLRGEFIEDNEQQRKLFRDVDEMRAMVEASLAFFRLDGQQEESTRFELGELIHTVLDDYRDSGQHVASAGLQQLVYLGRPLALKRALTNLVDNAVKYGTSALVTLSIHGREVNITIDDSGPGVPPHLLPKLFQPFFRVEPSRNRATGGFGLGLAAARSIVRDHGGSLILENRLPHGLRATITLRSQQVATDAHGGPGADIRRPFM